MTAFASCQSHSELGLLTLEIQTLNRKQLEVNVSSNFDHLQYEISLKKAVASSLLRGSVYLKINFQPHTLVQKELRVDYNLAQQIGTVGHDLNSKFDFSFDSVTKQLLAHYAKELFFLESKNLSSEFEKELMLVLEQALYKLVEMKLTEGQALQSDLLARARTISDFLVKVEQNSANGVQKYAEKLKTRIADFCSQSTQNLIEDERVLKEIAIFADKTDIAEEITRLKSHLNQFNDVVLAADVTKGKTLEFIVQECFREVTTIASKSSHLDITKAVILMKAELEKIKEQIQNIE